MACPLVLGPEGGVPKDVRKLPNEITCRDFWCAEATRADVGLQRWHSYRNRSVSVQAECEVVGRFTTVLRRRVHDCVYTTVFRLRGPVLRSAGGVLSAMAGFNS